MGQMVLILDFGGQYRELIARKARENGVYSEILPHNVSLDRIKKKNPIGIVLSGGPASVFEEGAPRCDEGIFDLGIPVLGICYGAQYMAHALGGEVVNGCGEYGKTDISIIYASPLFENLSNKQAVLMSHGDSVVRLPEGFVATAQTGDCPFAAFEDTKKNLFGLQFHPETSQTENGAAMISNFLFRVCRAEGSYNMDTFISEQIKSIREKVGDEKVLLGLSGGVDSSVCAALLSEALPGQLVCIFVDHGFMRKNEPEEIERAFSRQDLVLVHVDARARFLEKIKGVSDPERKRKLIGEEFIRVFEEQARNHGDCKFLAQGTIYPDVIESGKDSTAKIKSHHNVGGLPDDIKFDGLVEPLRSLFKDEVRVVGRTLGLPDALVSRQPFPGPGLAIRIIGEVTAEKLDILRDADAIWREEVEKGDLLPSQYFAVLTDLHSVGVAGDSRTYERTLALRAVITGDFMTAEYAQIPHPALLHASSRITNEVKGINRVVYDITGKPPATIEWE